jgi:hypothetical protein
MQTQTTRARHAAPRARRFSRLIGAVLRPITLTPTPLADARVADAVPSMELPEGHMAQRPRMLAEGEGRIVPVLATPDAPTIVMDAVREQVSA